MIPVILPGDVVFARFYCEDWVKLEFDAYNISDKKTEQHGEHLKGLVQGYVDKAMERLEAAHDVTVINTGTEFDSSKVGFPEILAIYRGGRDEVGNFGPFAARYVARKGEVTAEEMASLYEDFHGIELKKDEH